MVHKSQHSDATRASLLLRLKRAGPEREAAWTEFYALYSPIISGFARRLGTPSQEIDDLIQDVLKSFLAVAPAFNYDCDSGGFRSYLKACVCNKLTEVRRKRGRQLSHLDTDGPVDPSNVAIEAVWKDVWETEKLGRALTFVRQRYSTNEERRRTLRAFEMCTLLDRPTDQVAAELGLSMESVRTAKSRVSKALREEFDRLDEIVG